VIVPPAGRIIAGQRHIRPIFGECYGDPHTSGDPWVGFGQPAAADNRPGPQDVLMVTMPQLRDRDCHAPSSDHPPARDRRGADRRLRRLRPEPGQRRSRGQEVGHVVVGDRGRHRAGEQRRAFGGHDRDRHVGDWAAARR